MIGIDEVGRGPVAGPVTLALFYTSGEVDILSLFKERKLRDSKKLSKAKREQIYKELIKWKQDGLVDWVVMNRSAVQIDKIGISKCLHGCIAEGLDKLKKQNLKLKNIKVILDGALPAEFGEVHIKGDEKFAEIACASIVAKVVRDRYMAILSKTVVGYGFESNSGYGTASHLAKILLLGPSKYHRKTYLSRVLQKV
jgi:ribonuclease HII